MVVTPEVPLPGIASIRDPKDYPVLYSAVAGFVDVLVTGDKDFGDVNLDAPEILTPAEYCAHYLD